MSEFNPRSTFQQPSTVRGEDVIECNNVPEMKRVIDDSKRYLKDIEQEIDKVKHSLETVLINKNIKDKANEGKLYYYLKQALTDKNSSKSSQKYPLFFLIFASTIGLIIGSFFKKSIHG